MGRLTLVGLALGWALCACSGDDEKPSGGGGAGTAGAMVAGSSSGSSGSKAGSSGSKAGSGGQSAAASGGTQEEAQLCNTTKDCVSGLTCMNLGIVEDDTGNRQKLMVCARHCTDSMPCKDDEQCKTETTSPADAACVSAKVEILKPCDVIHSCTEELVCVLTNRDQTTGDLNGTCVQPCMLPDGKCPTDLSCVDTLKDGTTGICSKTVDRGGSCDDLGLECKTGDLCISDGSSALCYQDCTMSGMCDDSSKTCMPLADDDGKICDKP